MIDFNNEGIIQISCGIHHCLAISSEGNLYGWGDNVNGAVGCGKNRIEIVYEPIILKFFNQMSIKSIYTSFKSSFAITDNGLVYSWGQSEFFCLGYESDDKKCAFVPKQINISNVICVCPALGNTYFLTNDGNIYFCGFCLDNDKKCFSIQKSPKLIESEVKFSSLHSISFNQNLNIVASAVSEEVIYKLLCNFIEPQHSKTLFQFYLGDLRICFKTINLEKDFDGNDLSDLFKYKTFLQINSRIEDQFINVNKLGEGGYGTVSKVYHNWTSKSYAIKKIALGDEKMMREVNILAKLKSDFVVKYFDSWIENNDCLCIQMEVCFDNLEKIMQKKQDCFKGQKEQIIAHIEYFISCELFKELLECVQYLHELNPPVIHRDLKPQNIFIIEFPKDDRFLKLGDFGSARNVSSTSDEPDLYTYAGEWKYMAPEVKNGGKYNKKADIYSLGFIAEALFDLPVNR